MPRIRVKICCIADEAEAAMAATAGADLLGLVGPMPSGIGPISHAAAASIAASAPPWAEPVLLSAGETADALAADAAETGIRTLQIVRHIPAEELARLAHMAPQLRLIQVIHVEERAVLEMISPRAAHVAAFLLDSGRAGTEELGGTGRTHDWRISAEFVAASPVPVFLAGGLTPENVGAAIATVRPFGVDLCSGIRARGALIPERLGAFMRAVAEAGQ